MEGFAGGGIPETEVLVFRAREKKCAIGGKGDDGDSAVVASDGVEEFAGCSIPESESVVFRAREKTCAIGGKGDAGDGFGVAF
jgi:hypothetical protein